MGHTAVAITDHNTAKAFPEAMRIAEDIHKTAPDFKVIYGVEGYPVDMTEDDFDLLAKDSGGCSKYFPYEHNYSHITILAQSQAGLKNLYELISVSRRRPRSLCFPPPQDFFIRSDLERYSEGLLIGSACKKGALFKAVRAGMPFEKLCEIASDYDYLEIQPVDENMALDEDECDDTETLREYNRTIVKVGEVLHKPVAATGDVHYKDPAYSAARNILREGWGNTPESNPARYLRTTEEMLREFSYLGREKAYEVVIENTNKIAGMVERIRPLPEGYFPVVREGDQERLRRLAWKSANEKYGKSLPAEVEQRLSKEKELDMIDWQDAATMYLTVRRLVKNSESRGYPASL